MKYRVFVAIQISHQLQSEISEWKEPFLNELSVQWIPNESLHVTLVPPWQENDVQSIIATLKCIGRSSTPFQVKFRKVEFGPNKSSPRLIWAISQSLPQFSKLTDSLHKLLGRSLQHRSVKPHLTVARFKTKNFHKFKLQKLNEEISWIENVSSIVLMQSRLLKSGAIYEVLSEIELG